MTIQELVPLGPKTTMRIGGTARYFAEVVTESEVEEAWKFAQQKAIPLIVLGGGSNTIFADDVIEALIVRIKADGIFIEQGSGHSARVTVEAGKILGSLLNDLAAKNLDLSALTGIPGTVGGAIFGNAGQGPKGVWIDSFVASVTVVESGKWKVFTKEECKFRYRESIFKDMSDVGAQRAAPSTPVIWKAALRIPFRPEIEVKAEIERLIKKRIDTQPHLKTAGSCFKALLDGTPAWQLIDKAGLRGTKIGGIQISEKHANFLLNVEKGTFNDALGIMHLVQKKVPAIAGVEMRCFGNDGRLMQ